MLAAAGKEMESSEGEIITPAPMAEWPDDGTMKILIERLGKFVEDLDNGRSTKLALWKQFDALMDMIYKCSGAPNVCWS